MALSFTSLESNHSATDGTSYVTASFATTADRLYILDVWGDLVASGTPAAPTSIVFGGSGLSFDSVDSQAITTFYWQHRYRAQASSNSSGTITINWGATQADCVWDITEVDGQEQGTNGAAAFVQTVKGTSTGTNTTQSATLATFGASGNRGFTVFSAENSADNIIRTATAGGGYTELTDHGVTSGGGWAEMQTCMYSTDSTSLTPSVTWSGNTDIRAVIASEIKASTGGGSVRPPMYYPRKMFFPV
jgi:hypothetical protein